MFPNNKDTKDAAEISFKSLQNVLKRPTLKNEVKQLKKVFREIDGYPNWVIEQTTKKSRKKRKWHKHFR